MDEGHDADDEPNETRQHGEDHEGSGSVPVSCGTGAAQGEVKAVVQPTTLSALYSPSGHLGSNHLQIDDDRMLGSESRFQLA